MARRVQEISQGGGFVETIHIVFLTNPKTLKKNALPVVSQERERELKIEFDYLLTI